MAVAVSKRLLFIPILVVFVAALIPCGACLLVMRACEWAVDRIEPDE